MKRILLALALVGLVALPAHATPTATGCSTMFSTWEGCIHLVGSGLHVDTVQPGANTGDTASQQRCGHFIVTQQNPGGAKNIIHTSAYRCDQFYPDPQTTWGPLYTQNRNYVTGTVFCGYHDSDTNSQGCVTVHSLEPAP